MKTPEELGCRTKKSVPEKNRSSMGQNEALRGSSALPAATARVSKLWSSSRANDLSALEERQTSWS